MDPIIQTLLNYGVVGVWLAFQLYLNRQLDAKLLEKDRIIAEQYEKRIEAGYKALETNNTVKDVLDNAVDAMRESSRLMTHVAQSRGS